MSIRTVEDAQYQERTQKFDFDMIFRTYAATLSPGLEQDEKKVGLTIRGVSQPSEEEIAELESAAAKAVVPVEALEAPESAESDGEPS